MAIMGNDRSRIDEIIERAQQAYDLELTAGAREMLAIPVIETQEFYGDVNWDDVERSVNDIVHSMMHDADSRDLRLSQQTRSSLSVIRAFFKRFCNVPPFCNRVE
jgi:hypothetical protein